MRWGWRDMAFCPEKSSASENSDREVLAEHDAETTNSHKAQKNSENGSTGCGTTGTLHFWTDTLLMRTRRRRSTFEESETRECAKAKQRSWPGPGAAVWLRAMPVDSQCVISTQKFLYAGRQHRGVEEHLAATCPACGAADANTRHVRLCHHAGAQVNQPRCVKTRHLRLPCRLRAASPLGRADEQPLPLALRRLMFIRALVSAGPLSHPHGVLTPRRKFHGRNHLWPS